MLILLFGLFWAWFEFSFDMSLCLPLWVVVMVAHACVGTLRIYLLFVICWVGLVSLSLDIIVILRYRCCIYHAIMLAVLVEFS